MDNSDDEIGFRRKEEPRERSEATDKAKEVELQAMLGRSMTKEPSNPRDQLASRGPAPQQPDQPPLVPERHERPMFSHSQTIREEGAMTSLDNQIKKEMPDTVKTRLLLIKIAFFLNLLFLLIFFPTTMYSPLSSLLRQINDLSGRLSSAFAFPAYLAMEVLNLLVSLFIYASCTDLRRTLIKCSIGVLIVVAVVNLIIGIVVYSQSGGKKENFEGMTANEQLRFDSDVNKYTVGFADRSSSTPQT